MPISQPHRQPLFVRIPTAHAQALDRLAAEQRVPKQQVVTDLLTRYVRPAREALVGSERTGHYAFRPYPQDVLTLEEAAELLRVEPAAIEELANAKEIPGRELGGEWRFSREALLLWLDHAPAVRTQ